jgi:hypothetical protein
MAAPLTTSNKAWKATRQDLVGVAYAADSKVLFFSHERTVLCVITSRINGLQVGWETCSAVIEQSKAIQLYHDLF